MDEATTAKIKRASENAKREMEKSFRAWFQSSNIYLPEFVVKKLAEIVIQNMEDAFNAGFDEGKEWLAEKIVRRFEDERASHEDQTGDADWLSSKRKH